LGSPLKKQQRSGKRERAERRRGDKEIAMVRIDPLLGMLAEPGEAFASRPPKSSAVYSPLVTTWSIRWSIFGSIRSIWFIGPFGPSRLEQRAILPQQVAQQAARRHGGDDGARVIGIEDGLRGIADGDEPEDALGRDRERARAGPPPPLLRVS